MGTDGKSIKGLDAVMLMALKQMGQLYEYFDDLDMVSFIIMSLWNFLFFGGGVHFWFSKFRFFSQGTMFIALIHDIRIGLQLQVCWWFVYYYVFVNVFCEVEYILIFRILIFFKGQCLLHSHDTRIVIWVLRWLVWTSSNLVSFIICINKRILYDAALYGFWLFRGIFYALFIKLEAYDYPFCNVVYSKHMFLNVILRMIFKKCLGGHHTTF